MTITIARLSKENDGGVVKVLLPSKPCQKCKPDRFFKGDKGEPGHVIMEIHHGWFYYRCSKCDFEMYMEHDDILQHHDD